MTAGSLTSRSMRPPWTVLAGLALLAVAPACGDEIIMRTGGRIRGVVVEQTSRVVVIETGPGRVTLPMSRVERIVTGRSALEIWRDRSAALNPHDAQGWASLAHWADDAGLGTQAATAWQHVLAIDPANSDANRGVGRVPVNGAWLPEDEAYRARGYVQYEDRWVSPAEHEALVRERAADQESEQARHEGALRVREAEARAREAEARAREAEAAQVQPADETGGIPFVYAYGSSGYGRVHPYGRNVSQRHGAGHHASPSPGPPPAPQSTRPSSINAGASSGSQAAPKPPLALRVPQGN